MTGQIHEGREDAAAGREARSGRRGLAQFRRHQGGAMAIEFGIIAMPFFALFFAIIEVALMFWTNQELETAVSQISRQVLTGESRDRYTNENASENTEAFKKDICARASVLVRDCVGKLSVDVRIYSSFDQAGRGATAGIPVRNGALDTTGFGYTQPGGGQIVVVRAVLAYPVLFAGWSEALVNITANSEGKLVKERALIASTAFRTEPFLSSAPGP